MGELLTIGLAPFTAVGLWSVVVLIRDVFKVSRKRRRHGVE